MPTAPHFFTVDADRCIQCGRCARDCVADAIDMVDGNPALSRPDDCIACRHCLAVCPKAALSIFGHNPDDCLPNTGLPDPDSLKRLIHGRRSCRHFKDEDIPPDVFRDILETAWHAPTGVNMRGVHLAALATGRAMDAFRVATYARIEQTLDRAGHQAGEYDPLFREMVDAWKKDGTDTIFRTARHLLVASTSPDTVCVEADPFIALSYLDIYAQSRGVGTVWCGYAMHAIRFIGDDAQWREIGVPEGYKPAYAMLLGLPEFSYPRAVPRGPAAVTLQGT